MTSTVTPEHPRLSNRQREALVAAYAHPDKQLSRNSRSHGAIEAGPYAYDEMVLRALCGKGLLEETLPVRITPVKEGERVPRPKDYERRWKLTPYGEMEGRHLANLGHTPKAFAMTPSRLEALYGGQDAQGITAHHMHSDATKGIHLARTVQYLLRAGLLERDADDSSVFRTTPEGSRALDDAR